MISPAHNPRPSFSRPPLAICLYWANKTQINWLEDIEIQFDIEAFVDENDLEWMEVTQGRNGYPQGLYKAISSDNFTSFAALSKFAYENKLSIVSLHRKDG